MLQQQNFTNPTIQADGEEAAVAAAILREELALRGQNAGGGAVIALRCGALGDRDAFTITAEGDGVAFAAQDRRGLLFAIGRFLRKAVVAGGQLTLAADIAGEFAPCKRIRGHQLGFRGNNNTYDAWLPAQYDRYCREMMFFGANICEHVPDEHNNQSALMQMTPNELLIECSKIQQRLGMDLGLWYPVDSRQGAEEAAAERAQIFASLPHLQYVFIPGSDPGDLPPAELFRRATHYAKLLRGRHPEATMWVSAQMPHNAPAWPQEFYAELQKEQAGLDGVIIGPNHAFGVEELRRAAPMRFDYRLYPDITHNVRCEYPVHYSRDDWHFALASTLSRESVNPRPQEFRALHRQTRRFLSGGVSYSEGVNDDCNKMIWSDLDYYGEAMPLRESLEDYARLFFYEAPGEAAAFADALLLLEQNWNGDPAESPCIDTALERWEGFRCRYPALMENWRFVLHLFRARCDAFVRGKRLFELALLDAAAAYIRAGELEEAKAILNTPPSAHQAELRAGLDALAALLWAQIGIQLDVATYGGESWERGCTLDTIDRPITDLPWLLRQFAKANGLPAAQQKELLLRSLARNRTAPDEFYYSFALHGWEPLGVRQEGEFYLNFQGDRPCNDGRLPTSLFQVYDHFTLKCRLGGFFDGLTYKLRVTYFKEGDPAATDFTITANGQEIYRGAPYGGTPDAAFDAEQLAENYHSASYTLPATVFENGCLALEFAEPIAGLMLSEFWVLRA
ncbi:MAG: hypothetical protein LBS96_06145 [Oscillospiraceae bacterium]|jgi:hypothetical protein|nr:hypothetical protein [Oscillospiraceae bacterium]